MPWVAIDDQFFNNRKARETSPFGNLLLIAYLCYANQHLTDGFISDGAARSIAGQIGVPYPKTHKELINLDRVSKRDGGVDIHDYLAYQKSRAQVIEERKATAERVQRFRKKGERRNGVGNAVTDTVGNGVGNGPKPPENGVCNAARTVAPQSPVLLTSRSDLRAPLPGAIETESQRTKATALAQRAHQILAAAGAAPDPDEALDLVWWAAAHVDLTLVDEALGYCADLAKPPRTTSYLAKTIRQWAAQRDVDMPEYKPTRRAP